MSTAAVMVTLQWLWWGNDQLFGMILQKLCSFENQNKSIWIEFVVIFYSCGYILFAQTKIPLKNSTFIVFFLCEVEY